MKLDVGFERFKMTTFCLTEHTVFWYEILSSGSFHSILEETVLRDLPQSWQKTRFRMIKNLRKHIYLKQITFFFSKHISGIEVERRLCDLQNGYILVQKNCCSHLRSLE